MNNTRMYTEAETRECMNQAIKWYAQGKTRGYIIGALTALVVASAYSQIRSKIVEKKQRLKNITND